MNGTRYEAFFGRLTRITDRTGACHADLVWDRDADRLVRLGVTGATVDGGIFHHALLGDAHAVGDTAMTALDWARPSEIPAIAAPAALPLGAGGAILNVVALLAQRAGIPALRYAGPYPTAALWRSLARSFRCSADETAFTADALDRALRVARDPIPIDFAPAPHERIAISRGFAELRDGTLRAVIDGVSYEPGGSPARLVDAARGDGPDSGQHCEIWFGDARYARIATLAADGSLAGGPHPVPPCDSAVTGRAFPPPLQAALAELVADAVPAPLAAGARALCVAGPIAWADLGARAATETTDGFAVHSALWDRIAPLGLPRLALALAEALAPVISRAIVRRASPPPVR
jgi:hypothetical protein